MARRTDQLQAYQFNTQRVISALVMRETDPRQSPLRRGVGAVFGGLMVAILVAAGFGIYGILTKVGSDGWKSNGSVVVEKETGASFVYLNGTLVPTLNLTSAMLAAGQPNPHVFRVASGSLGSVPRGNTVGIAGAPASLPAAARRVGLPWTMCASPGANDTISTTTLAVALAPEGGRSVVDEGVLVKDTKLRTTYLIWHNTRYLVRSAQNLVPALFGAVTAVPVTTAWLNTVALGADIGPITVGSAGAASPIKGRKVGDVLVAQTGSGPQHYLVFDDGVAAITDLQRFIIGATSRVKPINVTLAEINAAARSTRLAPRSGLQQPPTTVPPLAQPERGETVCLLTSAASSPSTVWVGGTVAGLDGATPTISTSASGAALADRVLVPAGRVAVVRAMGAPDAPSGTYFIVTDLGIKYPVSAEPVLAMLGYPPTEAVDVPATLMARIPTGPTLDPAAAVIPVQITS